MILNKRILRELKGNIVRYAAMFVLTAAGLGVIAGMAASVDSIIEATTNYQERNQGEDGNFSLFVPMKEADISYLNSKGVTIEESFYIDLKASEYATLRVFKNRDSVNLLEITQGNTAKEKNEVVVEKLYADIHKLKVGENITIGGKDYNISGIGCVPDYIFILKNTTDVAKNLNTFSVAFVSQDEFNDLKKVYPENVEYNYSYINEGNMPATELKEYLLNLDFDTSEVTNKYMLEIIDEVEKNIKKLTDGVDELADGNAELYDNLTTYMEGINETDDGIGELAEGFNTYADSMEELKEGAGSLAVASDSVQKGLEELDTNSAKLVRAAGEVFDEILVNAQDSLVAMGTAVTLNKDNYASQLNELYDQLKTVYPEQAGNILELKKQLDGYRLFYESLSEYTQGVSEAKKGVYSLSQGTEEMDSAVGSLADGTSEIGNNINKLNAGMDEISSANQDLLEGTTKVLEGSNELKDEIHKLVDEELNVQYENLITFLEAENNLRITNYSEDAQINKSAAMIVGIFFMILIAFILSVFVVQNIDKERAVIGTLYSMGYLKKELISSFMLLPVWIVSIGAIAGTALGYVLIPVLAAENSTAFSYPPIHNVYKPYLLMFGLVLPILFTIVVNYRVLNKKLSQAPLKMLRKEIKVNKVNSINLDKLSFINCYRVRQFLREIRLNITLFLGLFLAIMIMMIGFCTKGSIDNYIKQATMDMNYNYMYLFKYPPKEIPIHTEATYTESLVTDYFVTGGVIDVTLQGIVKDSSYFEGAGEGAKDEIYISTSAVEKLGLKTGDRVILTDSINSISYSFKVVGVVDFTNGLYMFINIDSMRELFDREEDYFNTVLSMEEIDIEEGRVQTIVSTKSVNDACSQFVSLMEGTILLLIAMSILVFVITMYLLLKLMIDKSTFSISLIKVFGYNKKEIKKIYLGSGWYTVLLTALIAVPVCKLVMNYLFQYMVSNFASGMKVYVSPLMYAEMFGIIFGTYFVVNLLLGKHLKSVSLVEILKDRE